MKKPIIGFVGLTHLGLCYTIATASKGYKVYAYDKNRMKIRKLHEKKI